jgi:hypothetical protein
MKTITAASLLVLVTFISFGQKAQVLEVKGYGKVKVLPDKGLL